MNNLDYISRSIAQTIIAIIITSTLILLALVLAVLLNFVPEPSNYQSRCIQFCVDQGSHRILEAHSACLCESPQGRKYIDGLDCMERK